MKYLFRLMVVSGTLIPTLLSAQSAPTGTWISTAQTPDGPVTFKVVISDAGTYTVDVGNDNSVETNGKYEVSGDQMTIQDVDGPGACTAGKGVYTFKVEGNTLTMNRVSDACEGRAGPEGKMVFTKQ